MDTPNETAEAADVPAVSEREAILAEMEALTEDGEVAAAEPEAKAEEPTEDEAQESEDSTEAEDDVTEEPTPEVEIDDKALAALQRQEKRQKEALSADRKAFDEEREAFAKERQEFAEHLARFRDLEGRAKYDPVGVLSSLGLSPEAYEDAARALYSQRPGADPNPTAQRAMRDRETRDTVASLKDEIKTLREEMTQRDQRAAAERQQRQYLDKATGLVGEDTPILSKLKENNPGKFREAVAATAVRLWEKYGESPDHVDVIKELENTKRQELIELGFELPGSTKKPAQSPKTEVGKTLSADMATPTPARETREMTPEEERLDVLKGMASLE